MKIAIHQPEFIGYPGLYYKIWKADIYVVLDNVQYISQGFINRNRIGTFAGPMWITVPVKKSGKRFQIIKDVQIDNSQKWKKKILNAIQRNYARTPYFKQYFSEFSSIILTREYTYILDLNLALLKYFCKILKIKTKFILSSELEVEGHKNKLLINIIKKINGTTYICGMGAKDTYMNEAIFEKEEIRVEYTNYVPLKYTQIFPEFQENLCILDLLFHYGDKSREVLFKL